MLIAAFTPTIIELLRVSQPVRYRSRVKAHTSADAKRRNAASLGLLENRDPRDSEQLRQVLCGQGVAGLLDLICD
jgi:hypothetical protein